MRWDRLFEDLEGQLAAEAAAELASEVADRTRRERALVGLFERFTGAVDRAVVEVTVAGAGTVRGLVTGAGPDWVLLDARPESPLAVVTAHGLLDRSRTDDGRRDRPVLIALAAARWVSGLGGAEQGGAVARGFGLGAALRAVSRDRAVVDVVDTDGGVLTGTIDGVGLDYVSVAEHAADLPRRPENVRSVKDVPFRAVAVVRRR